MLRCLVALPILILLAAICQPAAGASTEEEQDGSRTVALVDDEPIRVRDLDRGIAGALTGIARQQARSHRLARLIELAALRHQVARLGVAVEPAAVEREFAAWSQRPLPAADDPCCGGHAIGDYLGYLAENQLTVDDIKDELSSGLAIAAYATAAWNAAHPGEAGRAAVIHAEGPALRQRVLHLWRISFRCAFDEVSDDPQRRGPAWRKAHAALARLRAGEDFAAIARNAACAAADFASGGDAGLVPIETLATYGLDAQHLAALPAGTLSDPLPGDRQFCLVRWQPLTDDEIIGVIRRRDVDRMRQDIARTATDRCRLRYVGDGQQLAPAARRRPSD